jgi:tRNA/rRNA methyltransferase
MNELDTITVILVRPKYAENIGSAARVALNMGIGHLCVVGAEKIDLETARKTATHNAGHLLERACFVNQLTELLADFSLLVGTTARLGRGRRVTAQPEELACAVLPYARSGKVGLVFGPENTGLANDELKHCGILVTIPTAEFSSMNLAQAVGILCYELRKGLSAGGAGPRSLYLPPPASGQALASMYMQAARLLDSLDMSCEQRKAAMRLKHLHQLLGRTIVTAKEAKLLKDACQSLTAALQKGKS